MTRDIEAAVAWYRDVCGWTFETMEMEDGSAYHVAIAHGRPVAGITDMKMGCDKDEVPPRWFTYFAVDDVDLVMEQTRQGGGKVLQEPFEVPSVGRIAIVRDPSGAALGVMRPFFPTDELVEQDMQEMQEEADLADLENVPV